MRDWLAFGCGIGLLMTLLFSLVFGIGFLFVNASCNELAQTTGHPTQFSLLGGGGNSCLIEIDGQWIPTSNWLVNSGN